MKKSPFLCTLVYIKAKFNYIEVPFIPVKVMTKSVGNKHNQFKLNSGCTSIGVSPIQLAGTYFEIDVHKNAVLFRTLPFVSGLTPLAAL